MNIENDDRLVGRALSRREALALFGATATASLAHGVRAHAAADVEPVAQVDIWHCDALGVYSDVEDRYSNTRARKFLRGYQISDERGVVRYEATYRIAMRPGVSREVPFGRRRGRV